MTSSTVSSGQFASGLFLQSGDTLTILSGGSASHILVGSGAQLTNIDGIVSNDVISGGFEDVSGIASAETLMAGGYMILSSGGVSSNTTVAAGGTEFLDGASSVSATIFSAGAQFISGGAIAFAATLSGGTQLIADGTADSTTIANGGYQQVGLSNQHIAIATSAVVDSGGVQFIEYGGFASTTLVQSGGAVFVYSGGISTSATIFSGGDLSDGGTASATLVFAGGQQIVEQYALASATFIASGGLEVVDRGGLAIQTTIAAGAVQLVMGATGISGTNALHGTAIDTLVDSGGTLRLSGAGIYVNPLTVIPDATLLDGGTIDVTSFAYAATETATLNPVTDILTLAGGSFNLELQLAGDYTDEFFTLTPDDSGGTNIVADGTPCYCRGTNILTDRGDVPVEHLRIGDRLITYTPSGPPGIPRPLRWIGRRAYAGPAAAGNPDALPVLIRAGALGNALPRRDLYVSPHHALLLDGVLVQAECLVNDTSILRCPPAALVEYFHLELDSHDIILAEGAPAETYVEEDGNRTMFHNAPDHAALYPNAPRPPARYCAPRVDHGPLLHAIRRRLAGPPPAAAPLRGFVERLERGRIAGWAQSGQSGAVRLRLAANGVTLAAFAADRPRADVVATAGGDLHCGFDHIIDGGLPHPSQTIAVIRITDGAILARL